MHCLLTPIAISIFPNLVPYLPGDAHFHRLIAIAIVLLGTAAFVPGYRLHRRKPLLALVALGISLILVVAGTSSDSYGLPPSIELGLSLSGSVLLIVAHLLNRTFCRQCKSCADANEPCHTTAVAPLR